MSAAAACPAAAAGVSRFLPCWRALSAWRSSTARWARGAIMGGSPWRWPDGRSPLPGRVAHPASRHGVKAPAWQVAASGLWGRPTRGRRAVKAALHPPPLRPLGSTTASAPARRRPTRQTAHPCPRSAASFWGRARRRPAAPWGAATSLPRAPASHDRRAPAARAGPAGGSVGGSGAVSGP